MVMKGLLNAAVIGIIVIFSTILTSIISKTMFGEDQNPSSKLIFLIIYSCITTMVYIFVDPFIFHRYKDL